MSSDLNNQIEQAQTLLDQAQYLVALTGAGISTPSGIPDFRSPDSGLWRLADPMQVASISAFRSRPLAFYEWLRPLVEISLKALPNVAHQALSDLERFGPLKNIITQNIDLLHSKAGSQKVLEVHGHMRDMICLRCGYTTPAEPLLAAFADRGEIPHCTRCNEILKPGVILLGEMIPSRVMRQAEAAAAACNVMLVAGTSLEVYPVNELPFLAHRGGARLIVINLAPTPLDNIAEVVIRGNVTDILPRLARPFQPQTV